MTNNNDWNYHHHIHLIKTCSQTTTGAVISSKTHTECHQSLQEIFIRYRKYLQTDHRNGKTIQGKCNLCLEGWGNHRHALHQTTICLLQTYEWVCHGRGLPLLTRDHKDTLSFDSGLAALQPVSTPDDIFTREIVLAYICVISMLRDSLLWWCLLGDNLKLDKTQSQTKHGQWVFLN